MPYPSSYLTWDRGYAYAPSSRVYTQCASGLSNLSVATILWSKLSCLLYSITSTGALLLGKHEELRVWVVQDWNQDLKLRRQDRQNLSYDKDACGTGHDEV